VSDQETLAADAEAIVLGMWDKRMRAAIRPLLTKKVIEEHRRDPAGSHSDALKRVLNYFRRSAGLPPYVIVCTEPFREWRVARLSGARGIPPSFVDERKFNSEAQAMHAVFLLRVEELARD
jgi:branched-chain amino acid transport system permease protein